MARTELVRCSRCGRRMRSAAGWNAVFHLGYVTGYLCPDCQTPEENAEAVVNEATGTTAGLTRREWTEHTPDENARLLIDMLRRAAEQTWRTWQQEVARDLPPEGGDVVVDVDALTDRTWSEVPDGIKRGAVTPAAVQLALDEIREHLRWLANGRQEGREP